MNAARQSNRRPVSCLRSRSRIRRDCRRDLNRARYVADLELILLANIEVERILWQAVQGLTLDVGDVGVSSLNVLMDIV